MNRIFNTRGSSQCSCSKTLYRRNRRWRAVICAECWLTEVCGPCIPLERESPPSSGGPANEARGGSGARVETSGLDAFASAQSFGELSADGGSYAESSAPGEDPLEFFGSPAYSAGAYRASDSMADDIAKLGLDESIGLFDAVPQDKREANSAHSGDVPGAQSSTSRMEGFDDVGLFDTVPGSGHTLQVEEPDSPSSIEHLGTREYEDFYGEVDEVISIGRRAAAAKSSKEEKSHSQLKVEDYRGEGLEDGPPPYEEVVQSHSFHDNTHQAQDPPRSTGSGFGTARPRSTNDKMKNAFSAVKKLSAKVRSEAEKRFDKHMKSWRNSGVKSVEQRDEELKTMAEQIQSLSSEDREAALLAMDVDERNSILRRLNTEPSRKGGPPRRVKARGPNPSSEQQPESAKKRPSRSSSCPDVQEGAPRRSESQVRQADPTNTEQMQDLVNHGHDARKESCVASHVDQLDSMFSYESSASASVHKEFSVGKSSGRGMSSAPSRAELKAQREARVQARINEKMAEKQVWDQEEKEKREARDDASARLGNDLKAWSHRSRGNIRALLGSLDKVLWESCGWKQINMMDLVDASSVKKQYRKAITVVHPDKVRQRGATAEQEYIADVVFDSLKEAYGKFEQGELRGGSSSYQPVFM